MLTTVFHIILETSPLKKKKNPLRFIERTSNVVSVKIIKISLKKNS